MDELFEKVKKLIAENLEIEENKKNEEEKNQKKAELEKKYWDMKKKGEIKPWEEKEIRRTILHEENPMANEIIDKNSRR